MPCARQMKGMESLHNIYAASGLSVTQSENHPDRHTENHGKSLLRRPRKIPHKRSTHPTTQNLRNLTRTRRRPSENPKPRTKRSDGKGTPRRKLVTSLALGATLNIFLTVAPQPSPLINICCS